MLTFNNLAVCFDDIPVIRNCSFSIYGSAVINLYGDNGTGKSSLLSAMAGLHDLQSRQILYKNKCILTNQSEYNLLQSYIGHKLGLEENLTVFDNLSFWASLYGHELILPSAIHTFDLEAYLDTTIAELSQGTKKRVALARLIISNSDIWMLDEPFANMDAKNCEVLENAFIAASQNNKLIIFTSHAPKKMPWIFDVSVENFK